MKLDQIDPSWSSDKSLGKDKFVTHLMELDLSQLKLMETQPLWLETNEKGSYRCEQVTC